MSLNLGLAREVYGVGAWSIDSKSLPAMLQILANSKKGSILELPEKKYNSISFITTKSGDDDYDDIDDFVECDEDDYEPTNEDIQGIGIVNLDGVVTVDGGQSSHGMTQLADMMLYTSKNDNIKGFIILANSGGGSTMAVEIMTDAIAEVRKTKPVYGLVRKGGMACSAAYAILTACEEIYAESEMSNVGSCGTMVQFEGRAANTEDGEGEKHIRLYATKSTKKNIDIEEALNNNNYKLIVDDMLNPVNERFLSLIEKNRPTLKGTDYDNGHDAFAKDSVGKFIDGIASKQEVLKKVLVKTRDNSNTNINQNSNSQMTKTELNQQHPELVQSIIQDGVASEKERVSSWMAYYEADPSAVVAGINSGKAITTSESHAFLVAIANKGKVADLVADSAKAIVTNPTSVVAPEENNDNAELEAAFKFEL
jgi:ClpP class serine protease